MLIDITGIPLSPGDGGIFCLGNGEYADENGNAIECCCDNCDYYLCCVPFGPLNCGKCTDPTCPQRMLRPCW